MTWWTANKNYIIRELVIFHTRKGEICGMSTIRNPKRYEIPYRTIGKIEYLGDGLANFICKR